MAPCKLAHPKIVVFVGADAGLMKLIRYWVPDCSMPLKYSGNHNELQFIQSSLAADYGDSWHQVTLLENVPNE